MSGNFSSKVLTFNCFEYNFLSNIFKYVKYIFSQFFNSTTKHTDKKKHYEKSDPSMYGTILVCLMSAFILIACFCFCRINPNAPHSNGRNRKKKGKDEIYDVKVERVHALTRFQVLI